MQKGNARMVQLAPEAGVAAHARGRTRGRSSVARSQRGLRVKGGCSAVAGSQRRLRVEGSQRGRRVAAQSQGRSIIYGSKGRSEG